MEAVVTTGAVRHAKLQSHRDHQQTNTVLFYRPDVLPLAQLTALKHNVVGKGLSFKQLFKQSRSQDIQYNIYYVFMLASIEFMVFGLSIFRAKPPTAVRP